MTDVHHDGKFSEGCFKTTEVEKKAGENLKIVVHFPPGKDPPGDEGKLLNRYIGDVAKDTGMLPVSTDEWRLVERSLKEDYWRTFFERKVAQNKKNTDKQKSHHAGGSRLYTRYHEELFLQTGKEPSRGEWWKRANLRPNGEWEDDLAAYIAQGVTRVTGYGDSLDLTMRDADPQYKGEHSSRVRTMGISLTPSQVNVLTKHI
ncbi:hypothetical protein LINPERHAP1_LOCUS21004 [Linum perenne]